MDEMKEIVDETVEIEVEEKTEEIMQAVEEGILEEVEEVAVGESDEKEVEDDNRELESITEEIIEEKNNNEKTVGEETAEEGKESEIEDKSNAEILEGIIKINESIGVIKNRLDSMEVKVCSLRKLADMHTDIETDLNNQITAYKNDFYRKIVRPILIEILEIQEDMNSELLSKEGETAEFIKEYVDRITDFTRPYGVKVEEVKVGDKYNKNIHRPTKAIPTDDKSLDMTIAKARRSMVYFINDVIVDAAPVQVYQYKETNCDENVIENIEEKNGNDK